MFEKAAGQRIKMPLRLLTQDCRLHALPRGRCREEARDCRLTRPEWRTGLVKLS